MSNTLLVPIHLDALCLASSESVLDTMADYNKLPYRFEGKDYNDGSPNLSEQILTGVFQQQLTLKAGIHLHWSIPDALTTGKHEVETTFPQVPNRWLIIRRGVQEEKKWMVESDYLYPVHEVPSITPKPITILMEPPDLTTVDPDDASTYQDKPYRYMGRSLELEEWQAEDPTGNEYASELTAIGTKATIPIFDEVKATFAAFYPNCYSVFGFHDPDYQTDTPPANLQYDVIGWYSDGSQDCMQRFLDKNSEITEPEQLLEILQEEFSWTLELEGELPPRTLYHSRITFSGASNSGSELSSPSIAIAESSSEALAAYLANSYPNKDNLLDSNPDKTICETVEEQLEALQLLDRLESRKLDIDAKFREVRHQDRFGTEKNGYLWAIMPQVTLNSNSPTQSTDSLPDDLAQALNELNVIQEQYNQAWLDIETMQRQLYSQWYYFIKYAEDSDFYRTVSETSLTPLRTAIAEAGEIEFTREEGNLRMTAKPLPFGVLSKLMDRFSNKYFSSYVAVIRQKAGEDVEIPNDRVDWSWITNEFECCGVHLSGDEVVRTIAAGEEFSEGAVWQILDNDQTYEARVKEGILTIYIPPTTSQIAFNLVNAISSLESAINNENPTTQYRLIRVPSQNYWRASDPAILLTGEAAKASNRFGRDGRLREDDLLECYPVEFDLKETIPPDNIDDLLRQIDSLEPAPGEESINFITWNEQPWNPFAFHWYILNYPCRGTEGQGSQGYYPEQILDNYNLANNAIDLQLREGRESSFTETGKSDSYTGFSILTPSVGEELSRRSTRYLTEQLLPSYYSEQDIAEDLQTPDYLKDNFETVKEWYENTDYVQGLTESEKAQDTISVALWAYEQMETLDCQAQIIGGFNDTLLLARPTFQLEVNEPLSTNTDAIVLTEQVRWTLGNSLQYEFLTGDIFNPIRSGGLFINQLRLVDSFGRYLEVVASDGRDTEVITTTEMTPSNSDVHYQAVLPPRLAQHARLKFYWLAADALSEIEMTTKPARNPVCGWIVPNNLDSTLGIYDQQGKTLGSLDRAGNWRSAPGGFGVATVAEIANEHLRKMVEYLIELGEDFQQQFISTLDNSLATIDPESFAQHNSLALLLGRPIAVVRATFSLEVKGLPLGDPTMPLDNDMPEAPTYGYTQVKFPIRLGDYQQLNDGLVGYWRETPVVGTDDDYQYERNIFYAPQSRLVDDTDLIQTEAEGLVYFEQTVDSPPQTVTMLIDPRGVIHATSGILPNRELTLPSENYSQALQSMEVNFLATPMLCDRITDMEADSQEELISSSGLAIPVPQEANAVWSWVSRNGEEWTETTAIQPVNLAATFSQPQQLYEGWLQLSLEEAE
ncbi:MAG: hypothetical protein AB4038_15365 [Prochloraceae cyanobacterium]